MGPPSFRMNVDRIGEEQPAPTRILGRVSEINRPKY